MSVIRSGLRVPSVLLIGLIRLYQLTIARIFAPRCRFHPSCSEYAIQSLRARGLVRGGASAAWRVLRCGPWTSGGLDPVPVSRSEVAHG